MRYMKAISKNSTRRTLTFFTGFTVIGYAALGIAKACGGLNDPSEHTRQVVSDFNILFLAANSISFEGLAASFVATLDLTATALYGLGEGVYQVCTKQHAVAKVNLDQIVVTDHTPLLDNMLLLKAKRQAQARDAKASDETAAQLLGRKLVILKQIQLGALMNNEGKNEYADKNAEVINQVKMLYPVYAGGNIVDSEPEVINKLLAELHAELTRLKPFLELKKWDLRGIFSESYQDLSM